MVNQMWIDEVDFHSAYFQKEPSAYQQMLQILADSATNNRHWESKENRQRRELKARRQKERENCQHGFVPFEIRWRSGIHPMGDRLFYVNIRDMGVVAYPVTEEEHMFLHEMERSHEHVKTVQASKDPMSSRR